MEASQSRGQGGVLEETADSPEGGVLTVGKGGESIDGGEELSLLARSRPRQMAAVTKGGGEGRGKRR